MFQNLPLPNSVESPVQIFVSDQLTADQSDHRVQLRQSLLEELKSLPAIIASESSVLSLNHPPQLTGVGLGVSHSKSFSAFAIHTGGKQIGVDVEQMQRVTRAIVNRVSSQTEQALTIEPSFIFCGKEAAFKALSQAHSVQTISQIETLHWQKECSEWYRYSIQIDSKPVKGRGFCRVLSDSCLSFFISDSTFS